MRLAFNEGVKVYRKHSTKLDAISIKKPRIIFIFLFLSLIAVLNSFAQKEKIDSLLNLLKADKPDSNKVNYLDELAWECQNQGLYTMAMSYAKEHLKMAEQLNLEREIIDAYNNIGVVNRSQGDFIAAAKSYFDALAIADKHGSKDQLATLYGNIGIIFAMQKKR